MVCCGILLKTAVMCVVLVTLVDVASAAEKLASCCTTVSRQKMTEPITGYMVQRRNLPCVAAIIFQTEKGVFCSQFNAPWVRHTIKDFEAARKNAKPTSPLSTSSSLLSLLTSSSSPTSSSPTSLPPTSLPPTSLPPTSSPPTSLPPTSFSSSSQ